MLVGLVTYQGPNIYRREPIIRITLDLGRISNLPPEGLGAEFGAELLALLGGGYDDADVANAGLGDSVGFVRGLLRFAVLLQKSVGFDDQLCDLLVDKEAERCDALLGYENEWVGLGTAKLACEVAWQLANCPQGSPARADRLSAFGERVERYRQMVRTKANAASTRFLAPAARRRDIPCHNPGYGILRYGQGRYQRRSRDTFTDRTAFIAVELSSNKSQTNRVLGSIGLPVPRQGVVDTLETAVEAASRLGYPVVIKPLSSDHGLGVSVGVANEAETRKAFEKALSLSEQVIVEELVPGDDHRLLVVNGCMVAAAKRIPGQVVGDGRLSVAELVALLNKDPLRGTDHENLLTRLLLDDEATTLLGERGYKPESIPAPGEAVPLRRTANLSTGGTSLDVTDLVHDDNRLMAIEAAAALELDVAGVDFLTTDIRRSFRDNGGAICEVNCTPGLRPHYAHDPPRPAADAIVDYLYPPGAPSRISIAALLGAPDARAAEHLAAILSMAGRKVGLLTRDGSGVSGGLFRKRNTRNPTAARDILAHPAIDAAVLEVSRDAVVERGLGFDRCSALAILEARKDDRADRVLIGATAGTVLLNADDPGCLRLVESVAEARVVLATLNADQPAIRDHLATGGVAFSLQSGRTGTNILRHGEGSSETVATLSEAALGAGKAPAGDLVAVFAAAMAWALGVEPGLVESGLRP